MPTATEVIQTLSDLVDEKNEQIERMKNCDNCATKQQCLQVGDVCELWRDE